MPKKERELIAKEKERRKLDALVSKWVHSQVASGAGSATRSGSGCKLNPGWLAHGNYSVRELESVGCTAEFANHNGFDGSRD